MVLLGGVYRKPYNGFGVATDAKAPRNQWSARSGAPNGRRKTGTCASSQQAIRPRNILLRSGFSWRLSGPAFECVRETADVLVAEQPCDLGNRQIFFPQVAFSEVASQLAQDATKRKSF